MAALVLPVEEPFEQDGPHVETARLVLRLPCAADYSDYAAMFGDRGSFRFSERGPMSTDEAWMRLFHHIRQWRDLGYGFFAVEEKRSGRYVGEVGLTSFRRHLGPSFDSFPETGWTVAPWARGCGYALEAAQAALAWIETELAVNRTVCLIHSGNRASLRIAHELGYRRFDSIAFRGYPAILHRRQSMESSKAIRFLQHSGR